MCPTSDTLGDGDDEDQSIPSDRTRRSRCQNGNGLVIPTNTETQGDLVLRISIVTNRGDVRGLSIGVVTNLPSLHTHTVYEVSTVRGNESTPLDEKGHFPGVVSIGRRWFSKVNTKS